MKTLMIGAGTIGLPFGLLLSKTGHEIHFYDTNLVRINQLQHGDTSFIQEIHLDRLLLEQKEVISFHDTLDLNVKFDCVVFSASIGNQTEEALALYNEYKSYCDKADLVLVRSTMNKQQWDRLSLSLNLDSFAYIPERSRPGNIIEEIKTVPQVIGHESNIALSKTFEFLRNVVKECIEVSVIEAITIKLLTNTWRSAVFQLGNKFFLDCQQRGVSYEKISSIAKKDYPRMRDIPAAGFVCGPCLPKDYKSWEDWGVTEPNGINNLNEDLLQRFIATVLIKFPKLKCKKVALFGKSYRLDYYDERGAIGPSVVKLLSEFGADVKIFSKEQKQDIYTWQADLVVNLFPHMENITGIEQFDFWRT